MFSMVAWYESFDSAAAEFEVNAVPDQHVFTSGSQIRVPEEMPHIIGEAALTAASTVTAARLDAPSLRQIANIDIEPALGAVVFGSPPEGLVHPMSPIPLQPFESVTGIWNTDNTGAAAHYLLALFSDGPQSPVHGRIYTVRATAAISLSAGVWVNGSLTFTQTLPVGRYQVVGMRARGTNLIAARLVFVGGINRPGVYAVNAIGDEDVRWFRHGAMGVFGEFHTNTPPTVDCLGVTDSSQTFLLDLVRVG